MISLPTAQELKRAGLKWLPELLDFFAIPDRGLDDKLFVISDLLVNVETLQDLQVVTFQGASEWALDYLATRELVWVPRESQLRRALEAALLAAGRPEIRLSGGLNGYRCEIQYNGQPLSFEASDGAEAYAAALLYLLKSHSLPPEKEA